MDPTGTFPPPPPADDATPPARGGRRALKLTALVLATVLIVGVPSAVALILTLNRGTGDELARVVPANVDLYSTVLLDPAMSQKRALQSVLERFPQLHDQQDIQRKVNTGLDGALQPLGVDFQHDVQPWLGSQVAFIGTFSAHSGAGALLVRTTNEAATTTAFAKLKKGDQGRDLAWSFERHAGVAIAKGTPAGHGGSEMDYAVFDHVGVIASDTSLLDAVIDADQGRSANLTTSAQYRETLADLPGDHLGVVYVNAAALVNALGGEIGPVSSDAPQYIRESLDNLHAYKAIGASFSVQPDAVAFDTVTLTDPSLMTASLRRSLSVVARRTPMLGWVPKNAYALLASSGSGNGEVSSPAAAVVLIAALTVIGRQTDSSGNVPTPPPSGDQSGQGMDGLLGPDGPLSHLTGDSALFVAPRSGPAPVSGVMVVGTSDPAGLEKTLQGLGSVIGGDGQGGTPWQQEQDGAVAIHYLDLSKSASVEPAYAMVDGYAVVGTDPGAVRAAIDAHRGVTADITAQSAFSNSEAGRATGSVLFLDLQRIAGAVRDGLSPSDRADYDKNVAPDVSPLRTLVFTSGGDVHHQTTHTVLTLGG